MRQMDQGLYITAVAKTVAYSPVTQADVDRSRAGECFLHSKSNVHKCPKCRTPICHTCGESTPQADDRPRKRGRCAHSTPTIGHLLTCQHQPTQLKQLEWHNGIVKLIGQAIATSKSLTGTKALFSTARDQDQPPSWAIQDAHGGYQHWMIEVATSEVRDVDLVVILTPGRTNRTLLRDQQSRVMTTSTKSIVLLVEVTTTTIGHLQERSEAKLRDMQPGFKRMVATLPNAAVKLGVAAITTTGVMHSAFTDTLEELGMSRAEVSKLYTACLKNTLRWVRAMKVTYLEGFKQPEEDE